MKPEFQLPDFAKAAITRYVVTVTDEMIDAEVSRLQNRYGNMLDREAVDNEENVLNVQFTELDAEGNPLEGGISKDNSLLLKYFKEPVRGQWMGKKAGDQVDAVLADAFDEKELEFILSDLGLQKEDSGRRFRIELTKVGLLEKKELNAEFFNQLYPDGDVVTESDFRNKIKEEIQAYWNREARNQIHDQVYHLLLDNTTIEFPEEFLKKWMKLQGQNEEGATPKTDEQVEQEFPGFLKGLKWTLITDKIVQENSIQVQPDEIRQFARQQLLGYMGGMGAGTDQPWMDSYVEKMMQDRKYVEDSYNRIQTQKIFEWSETQVKPTDKSISAEDFTKMVQEHHH
jgi:trigger factor